MDRGAAVSRFDDYTPEVIRETENFAVIQAPVYPHAHTVIESEVELFMQRLFDIGLEPICTTTRGQVICKKSYRWKAST